MEPDNFRCDWWTTITHTHFTGIFRIGLNDQFH
jgi:hypothetical protein